ncbi:hypothetical protein Cob_v005892 [Colletotrichum orbiculare MAFF 240422]|uniref:Uncharacterized protein n=1 Tax=Colletotrichum orbiculare (strain 104-T / ATCC 96160 / CBS 514.97 / LARS 414 / MAFF 240422) TaxID=1213857 RepID=A0A484FTH2_COLOR|nr:hypothetical protein Cob_v005892 [Colletotrichum orbiculare MAFF 240422]
MGGEAKGTSCSRPAGNRVPDKPSTDQCYWGPLLCTQFQSLSLLRKLPTFQSSYIPCNHAIPLPDPKSTESMLKGVALDRTIQELTEQVY